MKEFNDPKIEIIYNDVNLGFAKAVNIGINNSKSEYTVLLNNDIVCLQDWLSSMLRVAAEDNSIGVVGSILLYPDKFAYSARWS